MKALSIKQPWASEIALELKTIEVRSWKTNHRGDLLIVATKKPDARALRVLQSQGLLQDVPLGCTVAIVNLVDCRTMTEADAFQADYEYYPGAYAWVLEDIRPIKAFPVKGRLGLYEVELPEGVTP